VNLNNVSIIVPVFNEEKNLKQLYEEIVSISMDFEVVFVNDGSTDASDKILIDLSGNKNVKIITLNKNYGQTAAISAGIKNSKGGIVVIIDADLQNDPGDIPKLLEQIDKGNDVVSGWRYKRKDSYLRILPSKIANFIIAFVTHINLHDFGCTLKAYKREFIENLTMHGEMHRLLPAYCAWQGAKIYELKVNHRPRIHGVSKYGFGRTFKVILDLILAKYILSYMSKPIYVFGGISLVSFFLGLIIFSYVVYREVYMAGVWLSPLFFAGTIFWVLSIICLLMGILAEVMVMIYLAVKKQEIYKIK
jgi:glycosyltransferase involved in cell wall biosynthesis